MTLRRDHVAGAAFVVIGALTLALSGDLPFGTLASPGAGMLPTLVIALMMAIGLVLFMLAGTSPPLATIEWADLAHAARVVAVTAAAIALYTSLGFLLTIALILFVLTFAIERKPILHAAAFSICVAVLAYTFFNMLLKAPLPRGLLWL
jgi:putative tricarboxylic transport membrane protein